MLDVVLAREFRRRMIRRHLSPLLAMLLSLVACGGNPPLCQAQQDPIVERGIAYLRGGGGGEGAGEAALAALAMVKAEVPHNDPALVGLIKIVQRRVKGSMYQPERTTGHDIYEAGVVILALANHDPVAHRLEIEAAGQFLISKQNANGSWDYGGRSAGDTSISQYAVLGLWEAANAGVAVPPTVWDRAASWFLSVEDGAGGWTYHRDSGGSNTVSMTAAGVGSLLICTRQLAPYRVAERAANPLMIPLTNETQGRRFRPDISLQALNTGIRAGINWLATNFSTTSVEIMGPSPLYALYGIERVGALSDQATLGRVDWFAEGKRYIGANQQANGSFSSPYGITPATAWAVLFLTKSTAKSIKKIQTRRLGAGTLVGGRGLPKDLSQVSVNGGKISARPMDGAVEGMLAALEDPRIEDASTALAGLINRYAVEGPKALRPFEDRFRKLLTDPDQGVRRVGAWALARTGDQAMVPLLINTLNDPDEGVVGEARQGLQLQARMIDGFGPADGASRIERDKAIARWEAWYEAIRPIGGTTTPTPSEPTPKSAPARRPLP